MVLNKDKQIEEMAKICRGWFNGKCYAKGEADECNLICSRGDIIRDLYNAGYRKQSEVAREIIKSADELIDTICKVTGIEITAVGGKYLELRKKYTEESGNEVEC